jgi:hypothetical protein
MRALIALVASALLGCSSSDCSCFPYPDATANDAPNETSLGFGDASSDADSSSDAGPDARPD